MTFKNVSLTGGPRPRVVTSWGPHADERLLGIYGCADDHAVERFLHEARTTAQFSHPHIVTVHAVGVEGETLYIVSDFIDGVSLEDQLSARRYTAREAAELCVTLAEAMHHAHQLGVIHRDLKPSNILLDAAGRPYIADFGLAKREAGEITMTLDGAVLGTPA